MKRFRRKPRGKKRGFRTTNRKTANAMITVGKANADCLIADRVITKLCYCRTHNVVIAGSMNTIVYLANSLFDPEFATGGHQPRGFDQYSALFAQYRVNAVLAEVVISSRSAFVPFYGGIYWHGSTTVGPITKNGMRESKNAITKFSQGSSDASIRVKKYLSMAQIFGRSKVNVQADRDYSAGVGASPAIPCQVTFFAQADDETTSLNVTFNVKLTYYTEFNTPQNIPQS